MTVSSSTEEKDFRSGFVAVLGRPNVGKSTLVNAIVGQKISIVSQKPQTTRDRILCVYNDQESQIVFLDTPGMHKPRDLMNKYMVAQARSALEDADLAVLMVQANDGFGPGEQFLVGLLENWNVQPVLVVNKIDLISPQQLSDLSKRVPARQLWLEEHYICALTGQGVQQLVTTLKEHLRPGPRFFPQDSLSDRNQRYCAGEIIRESIYRLTQQEVPHSSAVVINDFKERANGKWYIAATIYLEAESQKGIVVGKSGKMIKDIGTQARSEIERSLEHPVYLELHVKVRPKWRKNPRDLKEFGYT